MKANHTEHGKVEVECLRKAQMPRYFHLKRRKFIHLRASCIIHLQRMAFKEMYQNDLVKLALEGILECVKVTGNDGRYLPWTRPWRRTKDILVFINTHSWSQRHMYKQGLWFEIHSPNYGKTKEILYLLQVNSAKLKATRMSRAQILCVCNNYSLIKFTYRILSTYTWFNRYQWMI